MPGLHGLNVHTFQVAHTRLRTKIHLSCSNHPFGALQRNFCRVSKVKIWFGQNSGGENITRGNGPDRQGLHPRLSWNRVCTGKEWKGGIFVVQAESEGDKAIEYNLTEL